jgi:arylsulfatase A-like enzyme
VPRRPSIRCRRRERNPALCLGRVLGLAIALAALGCDPGARQTETAEGPAAQGRPNLVLFIVDTLRADYTTPYGSAEDTSPELARWAARGVLFERVRAQSSWTKMSMASLLTSLWPHSHGIREAKDGLGESAVTLAEALRDAGYATYAVQTNGWLHQSFGFHQGFDRYMFPRTGGDRRLGRPSLWTHADRVVEEASRLIDAHDPSRPFFLYLHFMDVHEYAAPPSLQRFGTDDRGAYMAAIRWVDDAVRRVRQKLAATGDLERSILVFGADHGETFGEHGVHGHARNVLTPVVWVPLVFRMPEPMAPLRVTTQVRNLDIAPTLLELAGVPIPESFEGTSLVPLLRGAREERDRESYAALGVPLFPNASVQTAISDGSWTYARNATAPEDDPDAYEARAVAPGAEYLFDRRVDPGENANLITREPAAAERMRALLDAHLSEPDRGVVERGVRIEPHIADRLRAMGYLR